MRRLKRVFPIHLAESGRPPICGVRRYGDTTNEPRFVTCLACLRAIQRSAEDER